MDVLAIHARDLERCGRPLTREQERRLFQRARRGDRQAYEQLVHSQLRWVWRIASKFQGRGIALEDLIQIGHLGLLKAVEYWKPSKKCRLGTYATWHIRQTMQRAITSGPSVVRLPSNPSQFGVDRYELLYHRFVGQMRSLDFAQEDGDTLGRKLAQDDRLAPKAAPFADLEEADEQTSRYGEPQRRRLWDAIDRLTARQQTIVERRLEGATLEEIAEELAVSKERVRQIEKTTVRQLIYLCTGRSDLPQGQVPSLSAVAKVARREPACV